MDHRLSHPSPPYRISNRPSHTVKPFAWATLLVTPLAGRLCKSIFNVLKTRHLSLHLTPMNRRLCRQSRQNKDFTNHKKLFPKDGIGGLKSQRQVTHVQGSRIGKSSSTNRRTYEPECGNKSPPGISARRSAWPYLFFAGSCRPPRCARSSAPARAQAVRWHASCPTTARRPPRREFRLSPLREWRIRGW